MAEGLLSTLLCRRGMSLMQSYEIKQTRSTVERKKLQTSKSKQQQPLQDTHCSLVVLSQAFSRYCFITYNRCLLIHTYYYYYITQYILCSPGWFQTYHKDSWRWPWNSDLSASTWVLGLQACITMCILCNAGDWAQGYAMLGIESRLCAHQINRQTGLHPQCRWHTSKHSF